MNDLLQKNVSLKKNVRMKNLLLGIVLIGLLGGASYYLYAQKNGYVPSFSTNSYNQTTQKDKITIDKLPNLKIKVPKGWKYEITTIADYEKEDIQDGEKKCLNLINTKNISPEPQNEERIQDGKDYCKYAAIESIKNWNQLKQDSQFPGLEKVYKINLTKQGDDTLFIKFSFFSLNEKGSTFTLCDEKPLTGNYEKMQEFLVLTDRYQGKGYININNDEKVSLKGDKDFRKLYDNYIVKAEGPKILFEKANICYSSSTEDKKYYYQGFDSVDTESLYQKDIQNKGGRASFVIGTNLSQDTPKDFEDLKYVLNNLAY